MSVFSHLKKCAALLLCALALASAATAAARTPYFRMTVQNGRVAVQETETGRWLYVSDIPVSILSDRDRLLLQAGIPLYSRADFTTAVEDFCS